MRADRMVAEYAAVVGDLVTVIARDHGPGGTIHISIEARLSSDQWDELKALIQHPR